MTTTYATTTNIGEGARDSSAALGAECEERKLLSGREASDEGHSAR